MLFNSRLVFLFPSFLVPIFAPPVYSRSVNRFITPPPPASFVEYNLNEVYHLDDIIEVSWTTSFKTTSLGLRRANSTTPKTVLSNGLALQRMLWHVDTIAKIFPLADGNIFFFVTCDDGGSNECFKSHAFNVTSNVTLSSGASNSSTPPPVVPPPPSDSPSLAEKLGIGLGVGLGGVAILAGICAFVDIRRRITRSRGGAKPQQRNRLRQVRLPSLFAAHRELPASIPVSMPPPRRQSQTTQDEIRLRQELPGDAAVVEAQTKWTNHSVMAELDTLSRQEEKHELP